MSTSGLTTEEEDKIRETYVSIRNNPDYYMSIERAYRSPAYDAIPYFAGENGKKPYHGMGYFKARQLYHKIPGDFKPERAFFNAELPGGFVFAALDVWPNLDWMGSSFYPRSDLMVLDSDDPNVRGKTVSGSTFLRDKFGIYENNKDRWLIGEKTFGDKKVWLDGDLTSDNSIALLVALAKKRGLVDLYTADGGFEAKGDREDHPAMHRLLMGELICGISTLRPGGTLIVKIFGALQPLTQYLIAVAIRYFGPKPILHKPFMSRRTNNEFYLILSRRNNIPMDLSLDQIREMLKLSSLVETRSKPENLPFLPEPDPRFVAAIDKYAKALRRNLYASMQEFIQLDLKQATTFSAVQKMVTEQMVRKTAKDYLESIGFKG